MKSGKLCPPVRFPPRLGSSRPEQRLRVPSAVTVRGEVSPSAGWAFAGSSLDVTEAAASIRMMCRLGSKVLVAVGGFQACVVLGDVAQEVPARLQALQGALAAVLAVPRDQGCSRPVGQCSPVCGTRSGEIRFWAPCVPATWLCPLVGCPSHLPGAARLSPWSSVLGDLPTLWGQVLGQLWAPRRLLGLSRLFFSSGVSTDRCFCCEGPSVSALWGCSRVVLERRACPAARPGCSFRMFLARAGLQSRVCSDFCAAALTCSVSAGICAFIALFSGSLACSFLSLILNPFMKFLILASLFFSVRNPCEFSHRFQGSGYILHLCFVSSVILSDFKMPETGYQLACRQVSVVSVSAGLWVVLATQAYSIASGIFSRCATLCK